MPIQHHLTIFLTDGSKEIYNFISEEEIDTIKKTLFSEVKENGALTLMTEDKRLLLYPLTSILKLSISNVEKWQDSDTLFINVTPG